MFKSTFKKRVRYGETDKMGYLYYGNYAQLYEIGRVEMLRDLNFLYAHMEDQLKIMMPVVAVEARFYEPAHYDELLTITSILKDKPSKMITVYSEIYNEKEALIHKAQVRLFFIDMNTGKRVSTPQGLLDKLENYF